MVEADQGRITLDGEVPSLSLLRAAVDAARKVPGVRSVRSHLELEPSLAWHPYHPYAYGHPYDRDYFVYYDLALPRTAPHGYRALHEMTGEVTSVDRERGRVSLKTPEGTLDLPFPSAALRDIEKGDRLTVGLGLKKVGMGSASPSTEQK